MLRHILGRAALFTDKLRHFHHLMLTSLGAVYYLLFEWLKKKLNAFTSIF